MRTVDVFFSVMLGIALGTLLGNTWASTPSQLIGYQLAFVCATWCGLRVLFTLLGLAYKSVSEANARPGLNGGHGSSTTTTKQKSPRRLISAPETFTLLARTTSHTMACRACSSASGRTCTIDADFLPTCRWPD